MGKHDEIEITAEMVEAGVLVIEKYPPGEHDPSFVVEQVFRVMLDRLARGVNLMPK